MLRAFLVFPAVRRPAAYTCCRNKLSLVNNAVALPTQNPEDPAVGPFPGSHSRPFLVSPQDFVPRGNMSKKDCMLKSLVLRS